MDIIKGGILKIVYTKIMNTIITQSIITNPENGLSSEGYAIWDTGASKTNIHPDVYEKLKFKTIDKRISKGYHGSVETDICHSKIDIHDQLSFYGDTSCMPFAVEGYQLVIGMDIISQGDLIINNYNKATTMVFACPARFNFEDFKNALQIKQK